MYLWMSPERKQSTRWLSSEGPRWAVIVPRVSSAVAGEWGDASVELPAGSWTNALTTARLAGGKISLGELLKNFPVALLTRN